MRRSSSMDTGFWYLPSSLSLQPGPGLMSPNIWNPSPGGLRASPSGLGSAVGEALQEDQDLGWRRLVRRGVSRPNRSCCRPCCGLIGDELRYDLPPHPDQVVSPRLSSGCPRRFGGPGRPIPTVGPPTAARNSAAMQGRWSWVLSRRCAPRGSTVSGILVKGAGGVHCSWPAQVDGGAPISPPPCCAPAPL